MTQHNGTDLTEYLIDQQPSLAVVLRQKIGSQNTHYVHGLRGIASQHDGAGWSDAIADGLGSVRGWLNGSQTFVSDVNYNPYGVPDASVDGFGFTGEMTDANGLVYLRARYYDPNMGVFASLDPFEGVHNRPMSVNGYSWVEGNVANWVDPTGMSIIRIWASTFIEWHQFTFFHPVDFTARWHGDGRSWHTLDDFHRHDYLSSRLLWNIYIDTNTKWQFSYAETGRTIAEIAILNGDKLRIPIEGQANPPNPASITWMESDDGCVDAVLMVSISENSSNPLIFISPSIIVNYRVIFDLTKGTIDIVRQISPFPWHELHISIDEIEPIQPLRQPPRGPNYNPNDLFIPIGGHPQLELFTGNFPPKPCKQIGSTSPKIIGLPPVIADKQCLFK